MSVKRFAVLCLILSSVEAYGQDYTGYQVIEGTEVYTEIYESEGYARFSNACGSQILTQAELQAGAIPWDIIPCSGQSNSSSSCGADEILTDEGFCLSTNSSRVCIDRTSYCEPGYSCIGRDATLPCEPDEGTVAACPTVKDGVCDEGKSCEYGTDAIDCPLLHPYSPKAKQNSDDKEMFTLLLCNHAPETASVAIAYRALTDDWWVRGWISVAREHCQHVGVFRVGTIYIYAETKNTVWEGDTAICVHRPGPFDYVSYEGYTCSSSEKVDFNEIDDIYPENHVETVDLLYGN